VFWPGDALAKLYYLATVAMHSVSDNAYPIRLSPLQCTYPFCNAPIPVMCYQYVQIADASGCAKIMLAPT